MKILEQARTKLGNTVELVGNPVKNGVLIIGVFHGDEPQGKFLIEEYLKLKSSNAEKNILPLEISDNTRESAECCLSEDTQSTHFCIHNILFWSCGDADCHIHLPRYK